MTSIDGFGRKHERRIVSAIQRADGKEDRKAAAQARRDRRNAKRAHGENMILLLAAPPGGVSTFNVDGAYIEIGLGREAGRFQIIIVGPPRFTVEQYRDAAAAWCQQKLSIVSVSNLEPEDGAKPEVRAAIERRGFVGIIVEIVRHSIVIEIGPSFDAPPETLD